VTKTPGATTRKPKNYSSCSQIKVLPPTQKRKRIKLTSLALNDALRKKWDNHPNRPSLRKWADINGVAETGVSKDLNPARLKESKEEVVLEYMYPRLDAEVSKHLNHLLKSPFCVHPQTGRVCVPIDGRDLETFDPMAVPTAVGLLGEIDAWDKVHKGEGKVDGMLFFIFPASAWV